MNGDIRRGMAVAIVSALVLVTGYLGGRQDTLLMIGWLGVLVAAFLLVRGLVGHQRAGR
jgi:hypothetical protein